MNHFCNTGSKENQKMSFREETKNPFDALDKSEFPELAFDFIAIYFFFDCIFHFTVPNLTLIVLMFMEESILIQWLFQIRD